ncbi:YfhO family protein [Anaerofustis sp. LCP19S3_F7]|uniref:YfhO family protein n=1 Tax=Anaerofustis sp. LCP19S3_F7 TaxID=3440247 RepID=UPI003F93210B
MNVFSRINIFKQKKWFLSYTLIFLVISVFLAIPFIDNRISFIWDTYEQNGGDGFTQHYASVVYFARYIKNIFYTFINTHELIIPMWDLKIGTGYDILTTLNYYSFGDPLNIFYIFTPEKYYPYMFSLLVVLRLYLSGIFFSLFCFQFNKKKFPVIITAIGYAFCGYALYAPLKHPFFVNPMIYLPLFLLGAEKIFRGQKPYLFIIMVFVSAISNFYFFYMLTIAVVMYAFVRVLYLYNDKGMFLKQFWHYFIKFVIYYIIGILLSMVIMLPVILAFINSSRASGQVSNLSLFYNLNYYISYISNLFNSNGFGDWMFLGFNIIIVISSLLIFKDKSKAGKYLKYILSILFICSMLPVFSYVMNGFSYVTSRWCFIFAFLVCFINAYIIKDIKFVFNKNIKYVYTCLLLLFVINVVIDRFFVFLDKNNIYIHYNYFFILTGVLFTFIVQNKKSSIKVIYFSMIVLFVVQISLSGYLKNSDKYGNFISQLKTYSKVKKETNISNVNFIKEYDASNYYRIDQTKNRMNYGFLYDVNGLSSFFSIKNNTNMDYILKTGILQNVTYSGNHGYDHHIVSNTLKGVKYFIADKDFKLMDNFKPIKEDKKNFVYENKNSLGLFYTYDSVISDKEFNALDENDREFAMLQSVYLSDSNFIKPNSISSSSKTIMTFEDIIKNGKYDKDKIEIYGDKLIVKEEEASITLNLGSLYNNECYLVIDDFNIDLTSKIKKDASLKEKINHKMKNDYTFTYIKFSSSDRDFSNNCIVISSNGKYYIGKFNYVFNLGYFDHVEDCDVTITFSKNGNYNFSDMKIVSQPMDNYNKYVNELKKDKVENFTIKGNTVSLKVNTKEDKIGVLSIPYSKGWKAYVNGKEVEVLQANIDSMGIELNKGENEVVFKYCTPGLKEGAIISFTTAFCCIIYMLIKKKRNV